LKIAGKTMGFDLEQKPLRTWSHLAKNRRKPSEYDIVSKNLHYSMNNPDAPWEQSPGSPMNMWYKKYRNATPLKHQDWDVFSDPDKLVYRTYNLLQDGQENHVQSLFGQFNEREHDKMLEADWVSTLAQMYTPLRYVFHALQMSSTYVMQMAPSSTISNCATFQAADFLRRVTHTSYRTYELSMTYPDAGFGTAERDIWEKAGQFQPMRELVEKQLVSYDWSEAVVSLCFVVLPMLSEGVLKPLSEASHQGNDTLMPMLIDSQLHDARRHARWATEFYQVLAAGNDGNEGVTQKIIDKWVPLADAAIQAYIAAIPNSAVTATQAIAAAAKKRRDMTEAA
jgi:toluene monooxygenase system protein E